MEQAHDLVEVVDLAFLYKTEPPTTNSAIIPLEFLTNQTTCASVLSKRTTSEKV
jgi:hypothetical protein